MENKLVLASWAAFALLIEVSLLRGAAWNSRTGAPWVGTKLRSPALCQRDEVPKSMCCNASHKIRPPGIEPGTI